jgi:hypothetical protein
MAMTHVSFVWDLSGRSLVPLPIPRRPVQPGEYIEVAGRMNE